MKISVYNRKLMFTVLQPNSHLTDIFPNKKKRIQNYSHHSKTLYLIIIDPILKCLKKTLTPQIFHNWLIIPENSLQYVLKYIFLLHLLYSYFCFCDSRIKFITRVFFVVYSMLLALPEVVLEAALVFSFSLNNKSRPLVVAT